ncbi:Hypothetical_protein [Hexamita inflata]|uniref:Hypothetical_protein n=1 Tax=Hexamita inflata TaxID=28002 RepID=A0AA86PEV6_9EUKA|nr:Hypothetical protein HINF_LOCUS23723 [Hexamita inflata]
MLLLHLILSDKQIADKTEIVDCYSAATNIRFLTLNGQRTFRIYLDPTQKQECKQFPRGINITVFATQLVNGGGDFIPNSVIIYDFNYSNTVGISIPCTQCSDDTYFSSDQVIITIESAIHFTRVVMGAVQSERGLQVNCFVNAAIVIDFSSIVVSATPSGSCPQIVSADPTKLKNIISADFYIIYENNDIDRFEKLIFGSQIFSTITPLDANAINEYNISIPNVSVKLMESRFQYMQLQLHFFDTEVPVMAALQATKFQYASFPGVYLNVDMQAQKNTFYFDLTVNNTEVSPGVKLSDYYNSQLQNVIQPDSIVVQVQGYSSIIPSSQQLESPFQQKQSVTLTRLPSMTFTIKVLLTVQVVSFGFASGKIQVTCDMVQEQDCNLNLDKIMSMNDPNYNMNLNIKYYKAGVMLQSVSQAINKIYDSCFSNASALLQSDSIVVNIQQNRQSKYCKLIEGQKIDVMLNFTEYIRSSSFANHSFLTYSQLDFKYTMTFPISNEKQKELLSYISRQTQEHQLFQFIYFKLENQTIDQVQFTPFYNDDLSTFKQHAQQIIIYLSIVSILICVMILMIPTIIRKISPKIQERSRLKQKIKLANADSDDL